MMIRGVIDRIDEKSMIVSVLSGLSEEFVVVNYDQLSTFKCGQTVNIETNGVMMTSNPAIINATSVQFVTDAPCIRKIYQDHLLLLNNPIILDVRYLFEYETGHLPNAILFPYDTINAETMKDIDKGATIVVYCRSGHRSNIAAHNLINLGYTMVFDFGSIQDWTLDLTKAI